MAASDLLHQIAPGQLGSIHQDSGGWREVRCERVRDGALVLSLVKDKGDGSISLSRKVFLQTIFSGGVARIEGKLDALDPKNPQLGLTFSPSPGAVQLTNRRDAFRVEVSLRAKLRGNATLDGENLKDEWDCALKDMSIGGAKLVLKSPPPHARSLGLIRLALPTEEQPLHLACNIVAAQSGRNPPPMDAVVRIAFHDLPSRMETKLFKYINWVQLDMIRRGVR